MKYSRAATDEKIELVTVFFDLVGAVDHLPLNQSWVLYFYFCWLVPTKTYLTEITSLNLL
jgi:hypothetical protein